MVNIAKINNMYGYFDKSNYLIQLPTLYARHLIGLSGISYAPTSVVEFIKVISYFLKWLEQSALYNSFSKLDEQLKLITDKIWKHGLNHRWRR